MAIEFGKGITLASGFDLGSQAPLDSRLTVATIEERDAHVTGNRAYDGMLVFVEADKVTYQYVVRDNVGAWEVFGFNEEDFLTRVADDLVTDDANKALSAKQGKVLDEKISAEAERAGQAEEGLQVAIDEVIEDVSGLEERVAKNETNIGTLGNLATNAKGDLVSALNEVRAAVSAGGTEAAVSLDTSETTEGYLKSYTLYQGEVKIGVIDIPKELMAVSGQVVVNPEGMAEGTYLELTIQNGDPVYIDVASLIDNYTAEAGAAQIQLAIDAETRVISATIVAGAVGTNELADGAVTTVKILDANVTKAKLDVDVQASLDKADASASQAALDEAVEALEGADADQIARIEVLEGKFGEGEGNVESQITSAVAAEKAEREAADALKADKSAFDAEVEAREALDARVVEVEEKAHVHENENILKEIDADRVTAWDSAKEEAVAEAGSQISSLETVLKKYADDKDAETLNAAKEDATAKADEIKGIIGEVETGKTVMQLLAEARESAVNEAKYDDTQVKADIAKNAEGVAKNAEDIAALSELHGSDKDALVAKDEEIAGNVSGLQERIVALESVEHQEISQEEIASMFPEQA